MKKFLSFILVAVFCFVLSVCAFATEPVSQVDDELIADIVDGVGDLVDAESEGDEEALKQAIDKLYADLQTAQQSGNMSEIIDLIVEYALSEDADTSAIFSDLGAVEDVIQQVLADGGYDVDKVMKELQSSSALSTLVGLYTGASEPTTTQPQVENQTEVENSYQPEIENPGTGDSSTAVAIAFTTLVVSSAAAVIITKKKTD